MKIHYTLLTLILFFLVTTARSQNSNAFEIAKNLEIYADVFRQLNNNYVDEIKPGELSKAAIDALLKTLDPYTVYKSESEIEDFRFMTTGQYGGIGALIQQQGEYVVISEPYKGFPADKAGLKAGDKIASIDGHPTKNRTSDEVSEMLKGEPGTNFEIKVIRYGAEKALPFTITREKIQINDIPYYGVTEENIGYINLNSFTQHAALHVKKAFLELKNNHELEGIILDLRGNGGGLLNEAVEIVNLWVDKGELIVSTKGRLPEKNKDYYTQSHVLDADIPLVVLVNGASASASEIVAGAIQDLDRGIVLGTKTFGKGLVQNIVPLNYNSQIKITVAKYYIPSGRCIQAIDYANKENGQNGQIPDSLLTAFKTRAGRIVYDGGGVSPDIISDDRILHDITINLLSKNLIFDFCTQWYWENGAIEEPETFTVTDAMYAAFKDFLALRNFEYQTESEAIVSELLKTSQQDEYYEAIKDDLTALQQALAVDKKNDLDKFREEIAEFIRLELVPRYHYQEGMLRANLVHDPEIKSAISILRDQARYQQVLQP
ncbi:MAG: S41 family peptidase [Bacteroidales bacterium]|nr:S41 family peptidase [Bacteroidales bacterium]MDY0285708.1 S41 family peptidase [Bacteroidales bacterium]